MEEKPPHLANSVVRHEAIAEAAKSEACENENELIALVAKSLGYEISAGELERIKALDCGQDVGAGEIGMEMFYACVQKCAQIKVVADQSAVLVIELLHRRLVSVRIICGEPGDFRAELQVCRLMEKREAVEHAVSRGQCWQVQRVAAADL